MAADLSKQVFKRRSEALRARLVQAQVALRGADFPVMVVVAGFDAAGKGEVIQVLNTWLDPRGVDTIAFGPPSDEERERPPFWRYWRHLPPRGHMAIFMSAWNTSALNEEAFGKPKPRRFERALEHIVRFERMLVEDGALIVKFWLDLSRAAQRRRLVKLESDPRTRWRVTPEDWKHHAQYDRYRDLSRRLMRATEQPGASWHVVDGEQRRARDLEIGSALLRALNRHLKRRAAAAPAKPATPPAPPVPVAPEGLKRLAAVDLTKKLGADDYRKRREEYLGDLNRLVWEAERAGRSLVFVFEGWDAAGKGGAIRRLVSAIDPRFYRVVPVAKPTDEEKQHHYLWRFWRHLPRAGMVTVFDRSWYGRVLVERLEGFCTEAEWRRAFGEINEFEAQLAEHGIILVKFWLHISKEEQLARFRAREAAPHKRHKIDPEDWRNRAKWESYEIAVGDMVALTDTAVAPWHLVPANDKRYARAQVLKLAARAIERALDA